MTDPRRWLPTAYMDEIVPPLRDTPADWVMTTPAGAYALVSDEPFGVDDEPGRKLTDGEIILFDYCINLAGGTLTVTWDDDDEITWQTDFDATVTAPPGTDITVMIQCKTYDSLHGAARELGHGAYNATVYAWSSASTPYRFTAGQLVPLDG